MAGMTISLRKPRIIVRTPVVILAVLVLMSACQTRPPAVAYAGTAEQQMAQRMAFWQQRPVWSFAGRAAISLGNDGGNVSLLWKQQAEHLDISLSMPITGRTVRLQGSPGAFTLSGLEQGEMTGAHAQDLLQTASGWNIPFESLSYWVRGMPAPGAQKMIFDPSGRPLTLWQDGWQIDFKSWDSALPAQPGKVFIVSDDASVRLSIRQWQIP